jgi:hypothetical protein
MLVILAFNAHSSSDSTTSDLQRFHFGQVFEIDLNCRLKASNIV